MLRAHVDDRQLAALAARSKTTEQEARRQVGRHLGRLAASRRGWAQLLLGLLARAVLWRTQRIEVEPEVLLRLRRLAGRGPLVFLPAHRSYADSLVLAAALRGAGVARPWRLAGENLAFWPLGALARRSGTVFIRRDFGPDPAYLLAVRCRLADLLARGQSVEWYPEAGRSRTGRLRRLRHGMLRVLVGAYMDTSIGTAIGDVHVVPVSIVYDVSPEVPALTAQDAGAPKPAEGLRGLMRYLRACRGSGPRTARVGFAEPIALRELTQAATSEWAAARALARRVGCGLREATPATTESLLALAFPPDARGPLDAAALGREVKALLDYAADRGIPACGRLSVPVALERMLRAGVLVAGPDGFTVAPGRERDLAYRRNIAAHWFMPRAVAELAMAGAAGSRRVRDLLAPLGVLPASQRVERLLEREFVALAGSLERQPFLLAPRLLGPIFEAYCSVAAESIGSTDSIGNGTGTGAAAAPPHWPESRSAELRSAATAAMAADGLLAPGADDAARAAFAREMARLVARLVELAGIDAGRRAGGAHARR
ncbi:MAG TPA: 1-acyl-sn-glycerol-3-phosphate acyltransferase [Actinocrinis sp.]|jgi:glycerol-3-phosphate O-acyltransferase